MKEVCGIGAFTYREKGKTSMYLHLPLEQPTRVELASAVWETAILTVVLWLH